MNRERLEQEIWQSLDSEVEKARPPRSLVAGVLPRLEDRGRRKWWSGFMPRTRLGWALAGLVLALVGGTAYGATSLVRDFMRTLAPDIEDAGLMTALDLSQTIDGVTVRLEHAYADSNTVLLGYTIKGRNARYDDPARRLSVIDGPELGGTSGLGYVPAPDVLGWHPTKATVVAAFDGTAIQGTPSEVSLRFETSVSDTPFAGDGRTWGPFVFNFTLPFHVGKNVVVGQTAEAAGVPITLGKVLISPAGTSAVFLFGPEYEDRERTMMITSLQPAVGSTENSDSGPVRESSSKIRESDTMTYYRGDFTNRPGEWTLTVNELVFVPRVPADQLPANGVAQGKASDIKRTAGPWVFRFQVP
jgi:hypothetical protein